MHGNIYGDVAKESYAIWKENPIIMHVIYGRYMLALNVYTNKKETMIAVAYSDCCWNLQSTYTQVILEMTHFGLKIHIYFA